MGKSSSRRHPDVRAISCQDRQVSSVSVLLPVFNAGRFLDACLSSLAAQTLDAFEVVIVDDGSSDSTTEIIESWMERDDRLRVVHTPHRGLVAALNTGLDHCCGSLIARMDADDIAHPERLERQQQALEDHPEIDVLGSNVAHFSTADDGVGLGLRIYEQWLNSLVDDHEIRRDLFVESPLAHPSVMVRRRAFQAVDGYLDNGWPEDYDLWLRMAAAGATFSKLRSTLLQWRDHPERLTRTDRRYAVTRFLECKAHHLVAGPLAGRERVIIWGAGQTGRRLSKFLLRLGAPLEAFVDIDPRKCGKTLRRLPIISPEELEERRFAGDESPLLLAAVPSRGARAKIRARLESRGWQETRDFWCVA